MQLASVGLGTHIADSWLAHSSAGRRWYRYPRGTTCQPRGSACCGRLRRFYSKVGSTGQLGQLVKGSCLRASLQASRTLPGT